MIKTNFKESEEWTNNRDYNVTFLKAAETMLNTLIGVRGYIYSNEIYQALGIKWNPANENKLFLPRKGKYIKYPGQFTLEYFSGSELLLIHDNEEEF